MANGVAVKYSEYGTSSVIEKVSFELIENVLLDLSFDAEKNEIALDMYEEAYPSEKLSGVLSEDNINVLIRVLSQLKHQLKPEQPEPDEPEEQEAEEIEQP